MIEKLQRLRPPLVLDAVTADDAKDEGRKQRELNLTIGVGPAEHLVAPAPQADEHGERNHTHAADNSAS